MTIMEKKMFYKNIIGVLLLCMSIGCGKLELLKDASLEPEDAGTDLKALTIASYLAQDHSATFANLDLYARAIAKAGLTDLLSGQEDYTVLVQSNQAVKAMLTSLGYSSVEEVPAMILRNILSDTILKGRVRSFDLKIGETRQWETINGNHIYYSRTASASDEYKWTANQSEDLSAPAATVRSQNLEFKNGVAHVTDQFTFYKLKDAVPDAPSGGVGNLADTLLVSKDVYIQNGNANRNKNFNDATKVEMKNSNGKDVSVDRMGVFQYPLREPSFGNKIGLAKLNVYVSFTGLNSSLSVFAGADTNWEESLVTWMTAPQYDRVSLTNLSLEAGFTGWVSIDITAFVNKLHADKKDFVNILMNHNNDNFVRIYPKEFSSGAYKSFISLSSPPASILNIENLNSLVVDASSGVGILNTEVLKMKGTVDKNITYVVSKMPEKGYFVKYGIPLSVNASFSQTDVVNGAIRYLYSGAGKTDEFEVEAKDHNGGYYETPLKIQVNMP